MKTSATYPQPQVASQHLDGNKAPQSLAHCHASVIWWAAMRNYPLQSSGSEPRTFRVASLWLTTRPRELLMTKRYANWPSLPGTSQRHFTEPFFPLEVQSASFPLFGHRGHARCFWSHGCPWMKWMVLLPNCRRWKCKTKFWAIKGLFMILGSFEGVCLSNISGNFIVFNVLKLCTIA